MVDWLTGGLVMIDRLMVDWRMVDSFQLDLTRSTPGWVGGVLAWLL